MNQDAKRDWMIQCWVSDSDTIPDPFYDIYQNIYKEWCDSGETSKKLFFSFRNTILSNPELLQELDSRVNNLLVRIG